MGGHAIGSVAVYCAASEALHPSYVRTAAEFGALLAQSGRRLVYGGGSVGLMGALARACREAGGHVTGVITERLRDAELLDAANDENLVVRTMRERKAAIEARADAMVVLPGGLGTMEEFFEILVGRLLGEHNKPIVVVNAPDPAHPEERGYYDPLLVMIEHMIEERFAHEGVRGLFDVCPAAAAAIARLDEISNSGPSAPAFLRHDMLPHRAQRPFENTKR